MTVEVREPETAAGVSLWTVGEVLRWEIRGGMLFLYTEEGHVAAVWNEGAWSSIQEKGGCQTKKEQRRK